MDEAPPKDNLSRRAVLAAPCAAGAAALLAGCSTYGGASDPEPGTPATTGAPPAPPAGNETNRAGTALANVSDIPVGGGKIFQDRQVVVTQPQAGTIKAFSAICTHQGCAVTKVDGTIECPCHNSRFSIADGSVKSGPAPRGLPSVPVKVEGNAITLG